jgi:hypothetical protein
MTFFDFALGCLIGYCYYKVVFSVDEIMDKIMNTIERIKIFM